MSRRGSEYARHEDNWSRRSDEVHRWGREQHTAYEDDRYEDERRRNEGRRRGGDDRCGHEDERRRSEDRRCGGDRRPDDRFRPESDERDPECRDRQRFDDDSERDPKCRHSRLLDERDPECRDRECSDDSERDPKCRYSRLLNERDPECRDRQRCDDDRERDPKCRYSRFLDELDPECRDGQRFEDGRRRDSQLDDERRRLDRSPRRPSTQQRRSLTPTQSCLEANGSRSSRPCNDRSRDGSDGVDERNSGGTWKSVKHADDLKHLDGGREERESDDESEKTEFQSENGTWRPITPEIAQRIREAMAEEENRQKQEEARQKAEASRRRSRDWSGSEDDAPKPRRSDASRASTMRDKTPPRGSFGYSADRSPAGSSAGRSPMKASTNSPRSKKFSVDFNMAVEADDVAGLIWKFDPIGAIIRRLPEKVSKAKGIKKGDWLVSINNRNVEGLDRSRIENIWMQEQDNNDSEFFRLTFVPP